MNKIFLYLFVFLFAISLVFAAGENVVSIGATNSGNTDANGSTNRVAVSTMNQGESSQLKVETSSEFGTTLKSGTSEAKTSMSLNQDENGKTFTTLSNGMNSEIKVMPDSASEKALEVLGAKCEEAGCEIELKEVGKGTEAKAAYEVQA